MLGSLRSVVRGLLGRGESDSGGDADEDDESGFAFSLLDASVQYSHGQNTGAEAVRELRQADERASELESARKRNR